MFVNIRCRIYSIYSCRGLAWMRSHHAKAEISSWNHDTVALVSPLLRTAASGPSSINLHLPHSSRPTELRKIWNGTSNCFLETRPRRSNLLINILGSNRNNFHTLVSPLSSFLSRALRFFETHPQCASECTLQNQKDFPHHSGPLFENLGEINPVQTGHAHRHIAGPDV